MDVTFDCRFCGAPLETTMVDLGMHPLCQSLLTPDQLNAMEPHYPLEVKVCGKCFLAQVGEYVDPSEIFNDYVYYSSFSEAWLRHASEYVDMMTDRFGLDDSTRVLEIASNDGYLLQYFQAKGMDVLGIDPAHTVAEAAIDKGIPTLVEFFNADTAGRMAAEGRAFDVILGNNVLAHGPDINGFVAGLPLVLAPDGVVTFEFPHLMRLIEGNQFDTIYHEHWSYLSLGTTRTVFAAHGLTIFDVEELWSHGGSLRLFIKHADDATKEISPRVQGLLDRETEFGLFDLETYRRFGDQVAATKRRLLELLIGIKNDGRSIAIYGAAGKGNTLLNYTGIATDFIDYASDRSPFRQGRYTPGTHIPIHPPERIAETEPDYVLILPWNLKDEIMNQLSYIGAWGGKFIIPIPEPVIVEAPAS